MQQHVSTVGIDLAKNIFHLVGTDATGKIVWRKRLTRHALVPFMAQLPPVTIGMEACGGAHYWARHCATRPRSQTHGATVCQALWCDVKVASVTVSLSGAERTKPPVPPVVPYQAMRLG